MDYATETGLLNVKAFDDVSRLTWPYFIDIFVATHNTNKTLKTTELMAIFCLLVHLDVLTVDLSSFDFN